VRRSPALDGRYWMTLALASVFGGNTGDFVSDVLGLGHLSGLPILAITFAAILVAERWLQPSTAVLFWAAIIVVRTAATNVGDIFHDLHVPYRWSVPAVAAIMAAAVWLYGQRGTGAGVPGLGGADAGPPQRLQVDGRYWLCMALAGILGTVMGDGASFGLGLGTAAATVLFLVPYAAVIAILRQKLAVPAYYWAAVVLVRSGGTALGDFLARKLGLSTATAVTGLLFIAAVAWFYGTRPSSRVAEP
jgi:uncharacterized membrane-anchored protein